MADIMRADGLDVDVGEVRETADPRHGTEILPWEDLELTDWKAVEQLAQDLVRRLR